MAFFLGIDGGGTGCRAAVAAAEGPVLGTGRAGPANILSDPAGSRASIIAAAEAALRAAGGPAGLGELHAVLGLAGANVPSAADKLRAGLPFASARVEGDAVTALKGALGRADGITAALGTGTIYACQRGGRVRTIGGWGFRIGDRGSGAWLGRALLEAALLAHDGLRPASPLLRAVVDEAGGPEGLVAFAHAASPGDFAGYAPRVIAAEAEGDGAAQAILAEAEADVAAAIDHLEAEGPVPMCFLGGLGAVYAARLARRYAGLVREPLGTGLDGALAMARGTA